MQKVASIYSKTYHCATVMKRVWYWPKVSKEDSGIDWRVRKKIHACLDTWFTKRWREDSLSTSGTWIPIEKE